MASERFLLDTEVALLWAARNIDSALERDLSSSAVYLSSASVWEIVIKVGLGKLTLQPSVEEFVAHFLRDYRVERLPISFTHALAIGSLPSIHRDPFDRMLIAQAFAEDLTLVTSDKKVREYPVNIRVLEK